MQVSNTLKTAILLISIAGLLSGCATPQQRYAQDYGKSEKYFAAQDYGLAFQKIQVPAKAGVPDAQYALGYMYYYGKGTLVNENLAHYWFHQAATQGQPAAKRALAMLRNNKRLPAAVPQA